MQLRFHQLFSRPEGMPQDQFWHEGLANWVDGGGWGAVRVNGTWLLDAHGNRRTFKSQAGAEKAAKKFAAGKAG